MPDGEYRYQDHEDDGSGFFNEIQVTVEQGRITALSWDSVDKDGIGKRQLSIDGQYRMTEDGPLWYEQADTLARYVIENQSVEGLSDSEGYATDAVSSVSINISGFINALKTCLFNLPARLSHMSARLQYLKAQPVGSLFSFFEDAKVILVKKLVILV